MKRLLIIILLLALLFPVGVHAQQFQLTVSKPESIWAGFTDKIELSIKNLGPEDWFSISVLGTKPDWVTVENQNIKISSGETGTSKIFINTAKDARPATYSWFISVTKLGDGTKIEKEVRIDVNQRTPLIIKSFSLSCTSCKEFVNASVVVESMAAQPSNVKVILSFGNVKNEIQIKNLASLATRQVGAEFDLTGLDPADYKIGAELLDAAGNVLETGTRTFSVPIIENIKVEKNVSFTPFASFITLIAKNKGNAVTEAKISSEVNINWWASFSGPKPATVVGPRYTWLATLVPGESYQIEYSEIYWPTFVLIFAIIIGGIYLFIQFTALSIKKHVLQKYPAVAGKEFGISIEIKNRGDLVKNVIIRDIIPPIFSLVSKFETMKPVIKKTAQGTQLFWRLGQLRKGEERVLHYRIKNIVEVIGIIKLPGAIVRGICKEKTIMHSSNKVSIQGIKE